MPVPVRFSDPAIDDIEARIQTEEQESFILGVDDRLSRHPLSGVRLPPPQAFARALQHERWRVYYEPVFDPESEDVREVNVLRVAPARWPILRLY